jgi:hypothetical protein
MSLAKKTPIQPRITRPTPIAMTAGVPRFRRFKAAPL